MTDVICATACSSQITSAGPPSSTILTPTASLPHVGLSPFPRQAHVISPPGLCPGMASLWLRIFKSYPLLKARLRFTSLNLSLMHTLPPLLPNLGVIPALRLTQGVACASLMACASLLLHLGWLFLFVSCLILTPLHFPLQYLDHGRAESRWSMITC